MMMTDVKPVRERPIIFSGPMVRAIIEGRKTQTRRVLKPQPTWESGWEGYGDGCWVYTNKNGYCFPMGEYQHHIQPGDRLWVREAWAPGDVSAVYRADGAHDRWIFGGWKPSIHIPRWASRITLEVTEVRVQRLQDISEEDARAEGVATDGAKFWINGMRHETVTNYSARETVSYLWNAIHGPGSWDSNPWVAAITFKLANQEPTP